MSDELAYAGPVIVSTEQPEPRSAPLAVLLLLIGAVPLVLVLQVFALVAGALVIPLFDLTPTAVIVMALIARPWRGVAVRWLNGAQVLAIVMLTEWVPVWVLFGVLFTTGTELSEWLITPFSYAGIVYLAESVVLLVLVAIGSVASVVGILRAKREFHEETA